MKTNRKEVKAWAIVHVDTNTLCGSPEKDGFPYAIFSAKKDIPYLAWLGRHGDKAVRVTISYTLPSKKKARKKTLEDHIRTIHLKKSKSKKK